MVVAVVMFEKRERASLLEEDARAPPLPLPPPESLTPSELIEQPPLSPENAAVTIRTHHRSHRKLLLTSETVAAATACRYRNRYNHRLQSPKLLSYLFRVVGQLAIIG
ncbi:hypothetical protein PIB30_021896 [Stylosanthes scabra]|uniref:Uncharacterized protein n=1 Tax=Stylosanthes scabra TaxID=79078 RepID=A0ABU6S9I9_9FABA|nr:hypothetical protein [Stylosanthes scabra]